MINIPTLSQIITNLTNKVESELNVTLSDSKKVALRAIINTFAAELWVEYKVLGFVQKNVWVDTADPESKGGTLERFGRIRLGREPYAAVAGQYNVSITGTSGGTVQATQTAKSNDSSLSPGYLFILDTPFTLIGSTGTITLRALTTGVESKLSIGDTLTFTSPIPNVNTQCTVTSEVVQPLAAETIEDYRTTIVQSFQLESQGMSAGDIRIWCADAQGVAKVYPYTKTGDSNSFQVYVEAELADSIDGKGTPSSAMLLDVESVIEFKPDTTLPVNETGRRSMNAIPYVDPVTIKNIDITITGGSFTSGQQTLITNALTDALKVTRPYIAAAEPLTSKNDIISENNINGVIYAQVPGANYTGVTLEVDSVATASYTFTFGNIPYLNSVTFN